jgi:hypothetical protein
LVLGELEALALQGALNGIHGAPAQHTARGLVELGDACPRGVSDALRVGPGAAGGMELVDEMLGVAADALANLREFGLQFTDGGAADGGLGGQPGVRGLDVGWAAGALGVEAVEGEVLVVTLAHGGLEALDGRSLVAEPGGLVGAISVRSSSRSVWVSRMNSSVGTRARESAV